MKFVKIIVCLLALLVLSSCATLNDADGTTLKSDLVTESPTEPVTEEPEPSLTESEALTEAEEKPFVVNKNTKKYHSEDCRYVGFMNEENKIFVTSTPEKLHSQSYKPCSFCQN